MRKTQKSLARAVTCWATVALAACASPGSEAPALPANALPGEAGPPIELSAQMLSTDATDPQALREVLERAGFTTARQRAWTDGEHGRRAVARALVFGAPDGATAYLEWLRAHVFDAIGEAEEQAPLDVPSPSFLAVHEPGGCCPKEGRIFLAAWREGSIVLWLEVGGRDVGRRDAQELAYALDAAV